jgi:hypothetical protein
MDLHTSSGDSYYDGSANNQNELADETQKLILEEWRSRPDNPPSLKEMINLAFPDQGLDGRTKEGKLVKAFLATQKIEARSLHDYQPKEKIELSEDQKEYVRNNFTMMTSVEMGKILFSNLDLTNLSQEVRTINEYVETLNATISFEHTAGVATTAYKIPKTIDKAIAKINKYVHHGIDKSKVNTKIKKDVEKFIGYLNTYRFLHQINNYGDQTNRDLFESSFVRYTNDKPDLSQEEVDQYIVLSAEVVIASNIQRRIEHLSVLLDDSADNTEGRRISMALVESISKSQTEYNQCINRQQKLLEALKEKRSDRLKSQIKENASIISLVQMWKEEESRKKSIDLAEIRKKDLKKEIKNLSTMDEVKARILGLSEDEVLNG